MPQTFPNGWFRYDHRVWRQKGTVQICVRVPGHAALLQVMEKCLACFIYYQRCILVVLFLVLLLILQNSVTVGLCTSVMLFLDCWQLLMLGQMHLQNIQSQQCLWCGLSLLVTFKKSPFLKIFLHYFLYFKPPFLNLLVTVNSLVALCCNSVRLVKRLPMQEQQVCRQQCCLHHLLQTDLPGISQFVLVRQLYQKSGKSVKEFILVKHW